MKIKIFNTTLIRPTLIRYCKAPRIVLLINEFKRRRISVVKCDIRFTTEPWLIYILFRQIISRYEKYFIFNFYFVCFKGFFSII